MLFRRASTSKGKGNQNVLCGEHHGLFLYIINSRISSLFQRCHELYATLNVARVVYISDVCTAARFVLLIAAVIE
jgi:hypothetical protein